MNLPPIYLILSRSLNLSVPENLCFVKEQLSSANTDWSSLVAGGSNHLILQNIFQEYKKHELLHLLPKELQEHLKEIYQLTKKRNTEILAQIIETSKIFETENIEHIYTKGAGHLLDKVYPDLGGRIMGDIDVLVKDAQWLQAVDILKKHGYYEASSYNPKIKHSRKHYPRLIKKGAPVEIEVHYIPVKYQYSKELSTELVFNNKKSIPGFDKAFVMNDKMKIIHNFMHSQMDHEGRKTASIHLRNMYDMLLLGERKNPIETLKDFSHYSQFSQDYLLLIQKVFNCNFNRADNSVPFEENNKSHNNRFIRKHALHVNHPGTLVIRLFFMRIPKKFVRQFIQRPFLAIFNKEIRQHILGNMIKKQAWKRLFYSYRNMMGGKHRNTH